MESPETAFLDIRLSTAPGKLWKSVVLADEVTYIGRPEAGEPGVSLDLTTISRKHARIVRERTGAEATYFLENVRGRAGIRLYELILNPGERHFLGHGYVFQIPGVLATPTEPFVLITFCMDTQRTSCLSIMFGQRPNVSIFGQLVRFTPQQYRFLEYLYQHRDQICLYYDIIANIWVSRPRTLERIQAYRDQLYAAPDAFSCQREALDILMSKVRAKIRQASGGVTLIETVRGEGLCLRTAYISGCSKDS
jgi:DNA-binding winged helix-turn-helix (wHTH) protein